MGVQDLRPLASQDPGDCPDRADVARAEFALQAWYDHRLYAEGARQVVHVSFTAPHDSCNEGRPVAWLKQPGK